MAVVKFEHPSDATKVVTFTKSPSLPGPSMVPTLPVASTRSAGGSHWRQLKNDTIQRDFPLQFNLMPEGARVAGKGGTDWLGLLEFFEVVAQGPLLTFDYYDVQGAIWSVHFSEVRQPHRIRSATTKQVEVPLQLDIGT